jgi:hypothetical protein
MPFMELGVFAVDCYSACPPPIGLLPVLFSDGSYQWCWLLIRTTAVDVMCDGKQISMSMTSQKLDNVPVVDSAMQDTFENALTVRYAWRHVNADEYRLYDTARCYDVREHVVELERLQRQIHLIVDDASSKP